METYQGWKNYETWLVALHLSNTSHLDSEVRSICTKHSDNYDAMQELRDYVYDKTELSTHKNEWDWLISDLIHSSLSEVDFLEIVQNYREQ
jgi:hypothetical protein